MSGFMKCVGLMLLGWTVYFAACVLESVVSEAYAAEQPQQCARPHVCV